MIDFTPLGMLIIFVWALCAGAGRALGSAIMAALLGLLRKGGA